MFMPPKRTVLYLEDDQDCRELVTFTLTQGGMNVLPVETIGDAWQMAVTRKIDLYLLDGLIPNGDSLDLCRALRKLDPEKPIIFYSALAYRADIEKGLEAGATAYIVKPYFGDLADELFCYMRKEFKEFKDPFVSEFDRGGEAQISQRHPTEAYLPLRHP